MIHGIQIHDEEYGVIKMVWDMFVEEISQDTGPLKGYRYYGYPLGIMRGVYFTCRSAENKRPAFKLCSLIQDCTKF